MPDSEAIIASIETHCRTLTAGDKSGWLEIWADDVVLEDPVGVDTYRGIEALGTAFWEQVEAISPMRVWLDQDVIICGNEAIAILAAEVRRDGTLHSVGPIVDHFTFRDDGKISSMRAFWKYA